MNRALYVDNKGVRWDTNDADFEGYLYKQSRWVKGLITSSFLSLFFPSSFLSFLLFLRLFVCLFY